jgi:hypothetical protein
MRASAKLSRVFAALMLSFALLLWPAGRSEAGATGSRSRVALARAARTVSLSETGRLHLTSKHNFTLNETGSAAGTATGRIYVHLTAVSTSRVTAQINIYSGGGSISGHGAGSYRRLGATAEFSGTMSIDRGTGSFARIHGTGLSFSGTIAESHGDAITVHVRGRVSD